MCSLARLLRGRDKRSLLLEGWVRGVTANPSVSVSRHNSSGCRTATPSAKIFKYFAGNASVTVKGRKGFHHTPYASVSISDAPVSECDRGCRRSVNIALSPSMKYCKKP
jgi:hypothetical protein